MYLCVHVVMCLYIEYIYIYIYIYLFISIYIVKRSNTLLSFFLFFSFFLSLVSSSYITYKTLELPTKYLRLYKCLWYPHPAHPGSEVTWEIFGIPQRLVWPVSSFPLFLFKTLSSPLGFEE